LGFDCKDQIIVDFIDLGDRILECRVWDRGWGGLEQLLVAQQIGTWRGLELFLALGLAVVDWVGACGGGPEVGGVAIAVGLVVGAAGVSPPVVTTATRDELGGEAMGASWLVACGVGIAPCVGVLMVSVWTRGVGSWGISMGRTVARLWLPQGGVAQHWAGDPAG